MRRGWGQKYRGSSGFGGEEKKEGVKGVEHGEGWGEHNS